MIIDENIATHFAKALADGRYDKFKPSWEKSEKQRPTDKPPHGALFGGQYPIELKGTNE
jgi:hypothetical protein